MSDKEEQVQKIIRLKRHEVPREGYFEDFLDEFQRRRDAEESARQVPAPRKGISDWARQFTSGKWLLGAGVAYAVMIVAVLLWPKGPEVRPDPSQQPVIFEPSPATKKPTPPAPSLPRAEKPALPEN